MFDGKGQSMRVAVGMSGGVDSTVAAAVLHEQGHEVTGLTMSLWDGAYPVPDRGGGCYGPGEHRIIAQARHVAEQLGIPHYVVPLASEFRCQVLEQVRTEYLAGRTPNPCVLCNGMIKFEALWNQAKQMGLAFEKLATGHYARLENDNETMLPRLMRAIDAAKDQSYFLCRLTSEQLARSLFPLGCMHKNEVRRLAQSLGIQKASEHSESQDFLQNGDYSVLFKNENLMPGPIVHLDGRVLGEHRGLVFFTVGQRKGIGIGGTVDPLYVVRLDPLQRALIVGPHEALRSRRLKIRAVNWLAWQDPPATRFRAEISIRRQHKPAQAWVSAFKQGVDQVAEALFDEPQWAVTPGQTAALYDGDLVLGGGVIE